MGIGMRELIMILLIVLVVFGAKKLKSIGTDLGAAVKGFKKGMTDGETDSEADTNAKQIAKEAEDADFAAQGQGGRRTEIRPQRLSGDCAATAVPGTVVNRKRNLKRCSRSDSVSYC